MKEKRMVWANAAALTTALAWVVCTLFVLVLPELSLVLTKNLLHGLEIEVLGSWQVTWGGFLSGLILLAVSAWLFGWVLAWTYQRLSRK